MDLFLGSGTTMKVALQMGRNCIGTELNPNYVLIVKKRVPISELLVVNKLSDCEHIDTNQLSVL